MNNNLNRRDFLKLVGNSSMAVVLSSYLAPVKLMANDGSGLDDFKALVVIQMGGGNDGLSMFVPTEKTDYEQYTKARTEELRIKKNNMMGNLRANREGKYTDYTENMNFLNLGIGENNFYIPDGKNSATSIYTKGYYLHDKHFDSKIATNGLMPELANILDQGNGAVIQNVGNAKKIYKKENLGKDSGNLPPFGGSHDEQTILIETGQATNIYHDTGWMGRLADEWKNLDIRSQHGMNINLSSFGAKRMMQGKTTTSFNMSYEGPTDFRRLNKSAYQEIANIERRDIFKNLFNSSRQDTYDNLNNILKDWETVTDKNTDPNTTTNPFNGLQDSYGNKLFDNITDEQHGLSTGIKTHVVQNLSTAARLIYNAKQKGDKRIIISVSLGEFDTHSGQASSHLESYRGMSIGIDKFTRGIQKLGLSNNVTTFSISEFGRTTVSNGDGTDHGWGSSHFVLGGAVKGGNYGTFPDLTPGGVDDISSKGRLIPTTSMTQYYATLLKWFGVDSVTLNKVLPELKYFEDEDKDLGFMHS